MGSKEDSGHWLAALISRWQHENNVLSTYASEDGRVLGRPSTSPFDATAQLTQAVVNRPVYPALWNSRGRMWWRESCCARSAEGRAADPSLSWCICSYPDRRIGCYLGLRRTWWQQIQASHPRIGCYLLPPGLWWRQPCCARSVESRAADPSLSWCFCGYPDRRIGCYLGLRRTWWQQIQASHGAFAAILTDGSVVTWGRLGFGGESRAVQDQLKGVQQIQVSHGAFAAILAVGSAVTWGSEERGGSRSKPLMVPLQLS